MKTTLYIGQTQPAKGVTNDGVCKCFDSVQEVEEWLAAKRFAQKVAESPAAPAGESKMHRLDYCITNDRGSDGLRSCSLVGTRHLIELPASKSITGVAMQCLACDNHLKGYLMTGWMEVVEAASTGAKKISVCNRCCTNEAVSEGLCEDCLDKVTTPISDSVRVQNEGAGYCINRLLAHGCLVWSEVGGQYCSFCRMRNLDAMGGKTDLDKLPAHYRVVAQPKKGVTVSVSTKQMSQPRIRTVPTSARPCTLTNGCAGTMTGSLRRFRPEQRPELWWACEICRVQRVAELTKAVPDPRVTQAQTEALEVDALNRHLDSLPEPVQTDATEAYMHMREMLAEN